MIVRRLTASEVIDAYEPVATLYPLIVPLIQWRIWEYAAYKHHTLNSPVLDLGCGDGRFFRAVWPQVRQVTGVDQDHETAKFAREIGVYDHVHVGPANNLPFPPDNFASAFANCSLEHMDHLTEVISELFRCLRPGGHLLASVVTEKFVEWGVLPWLLEVTGNREAGQLAAGHYLRYHNLVNALPVSGWRESFESAGFKVVEHIPILPEFSARAFLFADQLWHISTDTDEFGSTVPQHLGRSKRASSGLKKIIGGTLELEPTFEPACGAVFHVVKPS